MKTFRLPFSNGKNKKIIYYVKNGMKFLFPKSLCRKRREKILQNARERRDADYIIDRVNYYCKLTTPFPLSVSQSKRVGDFKLKGHKSVYFFDSYQFVRWFPKDLRWCYLFGDMRKIPPVPTIVKSRELINNANSILLNLDKVRHFTFVNDNKTFEEKQNKVIFRGDIPGKKNRIDFMERWFDDADCDLGDVAKSPAKLAWKAKSISIYDHLEYKFIMSLEGNDVASNLKWIMGSNSLAVMPRPTCETWFMEAQLIPNYHYVEIKPDFSDLKERMEYYISHPEEAHLIIKHANEWVSQFRNKKREELISLLVLDKYFKLTNP